MVVTSILKDHYCTYCLDDLFITCGRVALQAVWNIRKSDQAHWNPLSIEHHRYFSAKRSIRSYATLMACQRCIWNMRFEIRRFLRKYSIRIVINKYTFPPPDLNIKLLKHSCNLSSIPSYTTEQFSSTFSQFHASMVACQIKHTRKLEHLDEDSTKLRNVNAFPNGPLEKPIDFSPILFVFVRCEVEFCCSKVSIQVAAKFLKVPPWLNISFRHMSRNEYLLYQTQALCHQQFSLGI